MCHASVIVYSTFLANSKNTGLLKRKKKTKTSNYCLLKEISQWILFIGSFNHISFLFLVFCSVALKDVCSPHLKSALLCNVCPRIVCYFSYETGNVRRTIVSMIKSRQLSYLGEIFASRERGIQLELNYPRPWKFYSPATVTQKVNYSYEREMRELTGYADDLKIPATSL